MAQGLDRRIKRQSVPESIRDSLQERILSGEFPEGAPLIQETLAEEYGASRMPVREALRQLEAGGLVAMHTHKGAVVTSIPTEQIEELFELRAVLESEILRRAVANMTDQDLSEARATLEALEQSYADGDMGQWGRLNWAFHRRLYEPARRVRTLAIIEGINLQIERYIRLHMMLTDSVSEAEKEHRELLRLCLQRDAAGAADFLRRHILAASRNLVEAVRAHRFAQ